MQKIFVVTYSRNSGMDCATYMYTNESVALEDCVKNIVLNQLDSTVNDDNDRAKIKTLASQGKYAEALTEWNYAQDENDGQQADSISITIHDLIDTVTE